MGKHKSPLHSNPKWSFWLIISRAIAYSCLFYIVLIYSHAKYNDPEGFKSLQRAFYFDFFSPVKTVGSKDSADLLHSNLNNNDSSKATEEPTEVIMSYSTPLPPELILKPATVESIQAQTIHQDFQEQRNTLLDLAVQCHHLEARFYNNTNDLTLKTSCYTDYAYYERKQNDQLAGPANRYNHHLVQTLNSTQSLLKHLKPLPSLQSFGTDLTNFISDCGEPCLPLARIIYDPPVITLADFKAWLPGVHDSIQEAKLFISNKLNSDHATILAQLDLDHDNSIPIITESSSSPEISLQNKNKIHSLALNLINSNFSLLLAKGIVDSKKDIHLAALNDLPAKNVQNILDNLKDVDFVNV